MFPGRDPVEGNTMNPFATFSFLCGTALLSLALTSSVAAGPGQSQSAKSKGNWSMKAQLPVQHLDAGAAAVDGKIYVLGGEASRSNPATPFNHQYDPATDRWRELAPMPRGISHAGVAAYNGKIYVVGGFTAIVHA